MSTTFTQDAAVIGALASTVDQNLKQVAAGLATSSSALASSRSGIAAMEATATDLGDTQLGAVADKAPAQLANYFTAMFGGINTFAQFIADLSESGGLEGGPNEMRLTKNGAVVPVTQDA